LFQALDLEVANALDDFKEAAHVFAASDQSLEVKE
jgi:hypothetical protein